MTVHKGSRYPNTITAYDAGYAAGTKSERDRQAAEHGKQPDTESGPAPLTVEDIKAGRYSHDELIERKAEVDALMEGQQ